MPLFDERACFCHTLADIGPDLVVELFRRRKARKSAGADVGSSGRDAEQLRA